MMHRLRREDQGVVPDSAANLNKFTATSVSKEGAELKATADEKLFDDIFEDDEEYASEEQVDENEVSV